MNKPKEATKDLERLGEYTLLYDFYGALLKDNNRQIFEDYMLNDLSLSEIAEERGISRQGVYDVVKRSIRKLEEYEEKLSLLQKHRDTCEKVKAIQKMIRKVKQTGKMEYLEQIERFTYDILE